MGYLDYQYFGHGERTFTGAPGILNPMTMTIRPGETLRFTGDAPMLWAILKWMEETQPEIVLMGGTQEVLDNWINPDHLPPLTPKQVLHERNRLTNIEAMLEESVVHEKQRKWWWRIKND